MLFRSRKGMISLLEDHLPSPQTEDETWIEEEVDETWLEDDVDEKDEDA